MGKNLGSVLKKNAYFTQTRDIMRYFKIFVLLYPWKQLLANREKFVFV